LPSVWPKTGAFSAKNEEKQKEKIQFWPKMKVAETIKNHHFLAPKMKPNFRRSLIQGGRDILLIYHK